MAAALTIVGKIYTWEKRKPVVRRLPISGGVVAQPGDEVGAIFRLPPGAVAVPGFVDPHVHLLAMAAQKRSLVLTGIRTSEAICRAIEQRHRELPSGRWLRGHGYDEAFLVDERLPLRASLDSCTSERPIVLRHRTGHEVLLNSAAMHALGLLSQPYPEGVVLDEEGQPTGQVQNAEHLLKEVPPLALTELSEAVSEMSEELVAYGVTSVTDAGHDNDLADIGLLCDLVASGQIMQRLEAMTGAASLPAVAQESLSYGWRSGRFGLGHVKIIPEAPTSPPLVDLLSECERLNWPSAIHVVEPSLLQNALDALLSSPHHRGLNHRLEHVSLCLPDQIQSLAASKAAVVTQPSFLEHRGQKYLAEYNPVERPWLYRVASFIRAGILVAASSDAPVVPSRPLEIIRAAVTRMAGNEVIAPAERVSAVEALRLVTEGAGAVGAGVGRGRGTLGVGADADVVILDRDPTMTPPHSLPDVSVLATFIGGQLIWSR